MDRNKKIRRNAIIALSVGLPIYAFIFFMLMFNRERAGLWHIDMITDILCLSLIPAAIIITMIVVAFCVNGARYKTIEDEVNDEKNENPETAHEVIGVLRKDEKQIFVLAYYYLDDMIRPAVYNIYRKRLTSIDLHTAIDSYKKIYPVEGRADADSNIRIMRIRNRHSGTKMIFFATKLDDIKLSFNGQEPERFDCENLGGFKVYGCEYPKNAVNTLEVNGKSYPVKATLVDFMFISKNEI